MTPVSGRVCGRFRCVRALTPATPGPRRASARPPEVCVVILVEILERRGGACDRHPAGVVILTVIHLAVAL